MSDYHLQEAKTRTRSGCISVQKLAELGDGWLVGDGQPFPRQKRCRVMQFAKASIQAYRACRAHKPEDTECQYLERLIASK